MRKIPLIASSSLQIFAFLADYWEFNFWFFPFQLFSTPPSSANEQRDDNRPTHLSSSIQSGINLNYIYRSIIPFFRTQSRTEIIIFVEIDMSNQRKWKGNLIFSFFHTPNNNLFIYSFPHILVSIDWRGITLKSFDDKGNAATAANWSGISFWLLNLLTVSPSLSF